MMIIAFLKQVNILVIWFLFCWLVKPEYLVRLLNKEPYLGFHSWAGQYFFHFSFLLSLFLMLQLVFFCARDERFVDFLAVLITWLGVPCRILFLSFGLMYHNFNWLLPFLAWSLAHLPPQNGSSSYFLVLKLLTVLCLCSCAHFFCARYWYCPMATSETSMQTCKSRAPVSDHRILRGAPGEGRRDFLRAPGWHQLLL